jgi:hypothetical protein
VADTEIRTRSGWRRLRVLVGIMMLTWLVFLHDPDKRFDWWLD